MYWLWINVHDPNDYSIIDEICDAFEKEFGISSEIQMKKSYEDKEGMQ